MIKKKVDTDEKVLKNRLFLTAAKRTLKLNLLKICPISRNTDHMILKFNLSSIKYNTNFQFWKYSFGVISSQKLFYKQQGKKQVM